MATTPTRFRKEEILQALKKFVAQRHGINRDNYGSTKDCDIDKRLVRLTAQDAGTLIKVVEKTPEITSDNLVSLLGPSGRLSLVSGPELRLEYTAGQYWSIEYRAAVCRVLARAIWDHYVAMEMLAGGQLPMGQKVREKLWKKFGYLGKRWWT